MPKLSQSKTQPRPSCSPPRSRSVLRRQTPMPKISKPRSSAFSDACSGGLVVSGRSDHGCGGRRRSSSRHRGRCRAGRSSGCVAVVVVTAIVGLKTHHETLPQTCNNGNSDLRLRPYLLPLATTPCRGLFLSLTWLVCYRACHSALFGS